MTKNLPPGRRDEDVRAARSLLPTALRAALRRVPLPEVDRTAATPAWSPQASAGATNSLPQTQGTVANPLTSLSPHSSSLPVRWRVHTPIIVDTHSGALLGTAAVTVGAGGAFMLVTGLEPSKTHSIWMNAWFDTGLALVILGLAVAGLGLYANFRKLRTGTSAADAAKPAQVPPTDKPRRPLPPLEVKILPDSGFERWGQSVRIAALHVEVKNTTGKDILVNDYEFSYDTQGRPTWEQQATNDEQLAVRQEIKRRDECQEHGQPLGNFTRINANGQVYGWLLAPISRNPAGGTPECTVTVVDDDGDRYPAKLPGREARTW